VATKPIDPAVEERHLILFQNSPHYESSSSLARSDSTTTTDHILDRIQFKNDRKTVSFASIEIRNYSIVFGDHPYCNDGLPLSLGWDFDGINLLSLDTYEATRAPRRSRRELRMSCEERRQLLSEDGVSEGEIRRAQRKMHRARSCSAKLCEKMTESFFRDEPKLIQSQPNMRKE
jgi:hypothetical protein